MPSGQDGEEQREDCKDWSWDSLVAAEWSDFTVIISTPGTLPLLPPTLSSAAESLSFWTSLSSFSTARLSKPPPALPPPSRFAPKTSRAFGRRRLYASKVLLFFPLLPVGLVSYEAVGAKSTNITYPQPVFPVILFPTALYTNFGQEWG